MAILILAIVAAGTLAQENKLVLKGTVVTPNQIIEDGAVLIVGET